MTPEEEDMILRDIIRSSATTLTEEQMREIEQEAPWIKLTDEGFEVSRGMVELIQFIFNRGIDEFRESYQIGQEGVEGSKA